MSKRRNLSTIAREIKECQTCKVGKVGKSVPGEGNPNAKIVFIGEAPGRQEAKTGRPFVGRSGQFLRQLIRQIDLREEDVFITSPVKYLPKRGTPLVEDIKHGREHLLQQLEVIDPKVIVLLGNVACQGALGEARSVLKEHGKVIRRDGRKHLITLHPAAALRFPHLKALLISDFQKLKSLRAG